MKGFLKPRQAMEASFQGPPTVAVCSAMALAITMALRALENTACHP